jgi:hypothetical protein
MEHDVHRLDAGGDGIAIHQNYILIRISSLAQGSNTAIDLNTAIQDQLFGSTAGGHTPSRKYLLQSISHS